MSNVVQTALRRERSIRVQPRRRGETAPTTVEIAPRLVVAPVVPLVETEVALEPETRDQTRAPTAKSVSVTQAGERRLTFDERQPYESVAAALLSRAHAERGYSATIFSATSDVDCSEIVTRLASVMRERSRIRVLVANELFPFRDTAVTAALQQTDSPETRQALQSRLEKMRGTCDFLLCAGGVASGSLAEIMGKSCDAGYLAIKLGRTDSAAARGALSDLHRRGIRVVGCVAVS